MREEKEILHAHDLLRGLIDEQIDRIHPEALPQIVMARAVLCWLLGHNDKFSDYLLHYEAQVFGKGLALLDMGGEPSPSCKEFAMGTMPPDTKQPRRRRRSRA